MLDRILRVTMLYDFYGALLTEKQRSYLEMHYLNDLSLSEIAEETHISRQAVHDNIRRAETALEEYEQALRLVERHQADRSAIRQAFAQLANLPIEIRQLPDIEQPMKVLQSLLER